MTHPNQRAGSGATPPMSSRGLRICGVCRGSGSLLSTRWGARWWDCPCCGGDGVEAMMQPKMFARMTPTLTEISEPQEGNDHGY